MNWMSLLIGKEPDDMGWVPPPPPPRPPAPPPAPLASPRIDELARLTATLATLVDIEPQMRGSARSRVSETIDNLSREIHARTLPDARIGAPPDARARVAPADTRTARLPPLEGDPDLIGPSE